MIKFKTIIRGTSSLLQGNPRSMDYKSPKSPEEIPAWLELQAYRSDDGLLYHPAPGVRNAFLEAAKKFKVKATSARTILSGLVNIQPEDFVLVYSNGEPAKDYKQLTTSAVNRNCSPPARVVAHRPYIENWEMRFVTEVNEEFYVINKTSVEMLEKIYKLAGAMIGIGVWRPQKMGLYGRFELIEFTKI